ncbi:MAG: glutamate-1-semialdehyde 2,1-aminomutase [Acidimicrobiia bacterium]|nr:glutamate-1-semialdehyde 2,1-aminomutase [Acidimicrobiia bacterium]
MPWRSNISSPSGGPAQTSSSPTSPARSPRRSRVTDDQLLARAVAHIPGGVNSPVRAFNSVGGSPFFVASGSGAEIVDSEGNRYLDYVQSWGASILGHANPAIVDAVQRAAADGTSFGAPTAREVELAEAICARVSSVEKVRLVSSGTEAAMTAIRLARGATGRPAIIKFAGCYHGHLDSMLVAAGSGVATLGIPGSAGVTPGAVADTVVVPYNDIPALDAAFMAHDVAAVIVEPIAANMGVVLPEVGFLDYLRARTTGAGALLIFDEVITGFRLGVGGAQVRFGITPDLSIFGKVVGGGLPLAAVGGSAAVMDHLAPLGPVYQAGTLSGNPLATAAGLAALAQLDQSAYDILEARAGRFCAGLVSVFAEAGLDAQVIHAGTLAGWFFSPTPVTNYEAAQQADHDRYARFFHGMLDRGVFFAPSGYETTFVSLAHRDADIDRTLDLAREVAVELA